MGFTKEAVRNRDVLIESRERNTFMSKELQIRNSTVDFLDTGHLMMQFL